MNCYLIYNRVVPYISTGHVQVKKFSNGKHKKYNWL